MSSAASRSKSSPSSAGVRGMHGLVQCAAGEQVDACRLELSRARSEQGEVEAAILDVAMHFVEEIGKALDLVDDHPAARRRGLEIDGEEGRIGQIVLIAGLVEKIDARRIGKLLSRPGALADPADAEEKEALPGRLAQPRIDVSRHVTVIFRRNMMAYCQSSAGKSMTPRRRFLSMTPSSRPQSTDSTTVIEFESTLIVAASPRRRRLRSPPKPA